MGSCSECIFWTPPSQRTGFADVVRVEPDEADRQRKDYGPAVKRQMEIDKMFGLCRRITLKPTLGMDDQPPLAITLDGSEYMADLYTQPAFGCVEFESKE